MLRRSLGIVGVVMCLWAPQALAQKVLQPWTAPRGAHESRIQTCTNPVPLPGWKVAMDDWICPQSGAMTRAVWWGTVSNPAQLQRRFYIAIYANAATTTCMPTNRIYQACVFASSKLVGTDCDGRRVYRFTAALPAPYFVQTQGQHYWFQVSEDDSSSVNVGAEDFRWSSHLPISPAPLCPAIQRDNVGTITAPIADDCPTPIQTDLAWGLFGTTITGTIPALPPGTLFTARLLDPQGNVLDTFLIDPDDDGSFGFEPDSPPGQYRLQLSSTSFFDVFIDFDLAPSTENHLQIPAPCFTSDFNHDGSVGTDADIAAFFEVLGGVCR